MIGLVLLEFGVVLVLGEGKREIALNKHCHSFRHDKGLQQACWKWNVCATYCLYLLDLFKLITVYAQLHVHYVQTQRHFTKSQPVCHCQDFSSLVVFKLCRQCWCCIILRLCFDPIGSKRGTGCSVPFKNVPLWSGGWTGNSSLTSDAFFIKTGYIHGPMTACRYSLILHRIW